MNIIIANWKMNLRLKERVALALALKDKLKDIHDKEIVVCPSFVSLALIGEVLKNSHLKLGAQDVFWQETGAYTGEESPQILKDLNCQYVIVGHSERRQNLGETDEMVNKKVRACLENGLTPIICVGETFTERQEGQTHSVVLLQVSRALTNIDLISDNNIIIAYEPVWVIGSGQSADPEETHEVFKLIRQTLIDLYPLSLVNNIRLIYGGSVDSENVKNFSELGLGSGLLVGGASLDAEEFVKIVKEFG